MDQQGSPSQNPQQSSAEINAYVQNLMQQLQQRFQTMSDNIIARMDDMGSKLDGLEKSVAEILDRAAQQDSDGDASKH
jgi:heat shock factor-binding protein 1